MDYFSILIDIIFFFRSERKIRELINDLNVSSNKLEEAIRSQKGE